MKLLIVFALALTTAAGGDLRGNQIKTHINLSPVAEAESRIIDGVQAQNGEFPYVAGLLLLLESNIFKWCTGSIIHHEWILTAAHCTYDVKEIRVLLGDVLRTTPKLTHTVQKQNIINHPEFNLTSIKNDISLIKIPYTTYTPYIRNVKMPAIASSYPTYAGNNTVTAGWGYVSASEPTPNHLRFARFDVITNAKCRKDFNVFPSHICVSTLSGLSPCEGDSGSPLVLVRQQKLIGVTSVVSADGCTNDLPAVYTRVTSYLDWIKGRTGISY